MRHTYYNRLNIKTGEIEQLPFADIDGTCFGVRFERGSTVVYDHSVALEIVNRWNEISASNRCGLQYWV